MAFLSSQDQINRAVAGGAVPVQTSQGEKGPGRPSTFTCPGFCPG